MAKYSDDAKYVSAFNAAQKADNKAKLLLQDLNRATPGTAKHTELKTKYDAAKALFKKEEDKRIARKAEIDNAVAKEKADKETAKIKESLKTELPQLEYQLQVAKNKGDAAGINTAQLAIKAAQDKAAGIKTKAPEGVVQGQDTVLQADVSLTDFLYQYTEADRQKMIDDVSVTLRGQGITDADKSAKWYKDLKKSIDNMISTGTVSTSKKVKNPKTGQLETQLISTPGFSQEQAASVAEKAIRKATPEDVARKERVDFTSWMFGTLGGSNG
jgi:outer membrane translocation and assembly module TamA